jgi:hypothetical protein
MPNRPLTRCVSVVTIGRGVSGERRRGCRAWPRYCLFCCSSFSSGLPAYAIGQRRGTDNAWVAFIPFFGPTVVLLWSMERSGWMSLLGFVPLVNIIFSIWILSAMPHAHYRTR